MSATDDIRRQWVKASLEGRFATADYLATHLPPVPLIRPPHDSRERWGTAGEIGER